MITVFNVPTRNLNNSSLSSGLVNLNNFVQVDNCAGMLLRYEVTNVVAGESLTFTYSIYVNGVFRSGSTLVFTENSTGGIGFDVGGKDDTTQVQGDLTAVGTVRITATLYAIEVGEDIL